MVMMTVMIMTKATASNNDTKRKRERDLIWLKLYIEYFVEISGCAVENEIFTFEHAHHMI